MTDQYRGTGRPPGPVGISPVQPRGTLWQKQSSSPPPNATKTGAKTVMKTVMPLPLDDSASKNVHAFTEPLFNASKRAPAFDDIKQASSLVNCSLPSILAALAFTVPGRNKLTKLIVETTAPTSTEFPGLDPATLSTPPANMKIISSRYFTVSLPRGEQVVSDVLYTDDADRNWSALYLHDPRDKSIWGALIEKALALQLGSYKDFGVGGKSLPAEVFWEKIVGAAPGILAIDDRTPSDEILKAARNSTRVSSIAASKPNFGGMKVASPFHGHAMLGMAGSRLKLYDPMKAATLEISVADFRHDFLAILFLK